MFCFSWPFWLILDFYPKIILAGMLWGNLWQRQGLHRVTGPSWAQSAIHFKSPALDSRAPHLGESLDYLNQQQILDTRGAGNSEINAILVAERDIFFRQERITVWIKSDRSPEQHDIPPCTPKVAIPAEGNWGSVKGTAANNPHSSSGAMATHGRWEESEHPAGEWSHFLHQSCFSGFLQTPKRELLHRLWSHRVSRLFGGFPSEETFLC